MPVFGKKPVPSVTFPTRQTPDPLRARPTWGRSAWAVLRKDLRLELRSRLALHTMLVFALSTVLLVWFALGAQPVAPHVQAALLWTVLLFAAALGLGRVFVQEDERGTLLFLRLAAHPTGVYTGKLLFNLLLVLLIGGVACGAFVLVLGVEVVEVWLFLLVLTLGAAGLAAATTLLAALIARASHSGALLPVLLFPLLVPLLLSGVRLTRSALEGGLGWSGAGDGLVTLAAYPPALVAASVLLFDFVWYD